MSHRLKLFFFALAAVAVLFLLDTAYEAINTLRRLEVVEAERDRWQRPGDIIASLNLKQGSTVVDLGCGSGYFSLKLSEVVGTTGKVYAVDIRRLPLAFLWARTVSRHRNVKRVLAEPDDPKLPSNVANAVLIANTYHEFENPDAILKKVMQSLVPGGRLVVVDPAETEHGKLSLQLVENELRRKGFDIVSREDRFIEQPGGKAWWRVVAEKP